MATVVNDTGQKYSQVPLSEQMMLVKYVIQLIKDSGVFKGKGIKVNFLDADKDCICIRLMDDNIKTSEYVDGSYDAQIRFMVISRHLNVSGVSGHINAMDEINQLGMLFDSIDYYDIENDRVYIDSIDQVSNAGVVYRDSSGIEDNGATFVLRYSKK